MKKYCRILLDLLILLIITTPSFISLLNNQYFTIHDNQHIVRLYLLDKGIKQGYLYPRWVDELTFGFGDPLFNFYPPLVYYIGETFHLLGFSFIWSVKLVFIFGFIIGAISSYLLVKEFLGRLAGFLGATVFTYYFYHLINAYVRGALSEFLAMNIAPFVFLFLYRLSKTPHLKNSLYLALSTVLVVLAHQLVVLPLVFFLFFFFIYCFLTTPDKKKFFYYATFAGILGLGLSAFYWLPMFYERKFTFLEMELGGYQEHFISPYQLWYSPWGFGASVKGIEDGMSFQLGKIIILLVAFSIISFFIFQFSHQGWRKANIYLNQFIFFLAVMIFGLLMTTAYSAFIWDNFKLLENLQFPWRFLSVTAVFITLVSCYWIIFLQKIIENKKLRPPFSDYPLSSSNSKTIVVKSLIIFFIGLIIFKYQRYCYPLKYLDVKDKDLLTKEEIQWRQSHLLFVPKGVKTKKNQYGVHGLDIKKKDLPKTIYEIKKGQGKVVTIKNKYQEKEFRIKAKTALLFQLNTFHFPGWQAYLNNKKISINDNNPYKLINVFIPQGNYNLSFLFTDTLVRKIGNCLSILSLLFFLLLFVYKTKHHSSHFLLTSKK